MLEIGDLQSPGATARSYRHALSVGADISTMKPQCLAPSVTNCGSLAGALLASQRHDEVGCPKEKRSQLQEETGKECEMVHGPGVRMSRLGCRPRYLTSGLVHRPSFSLQPLPQNMMSYLALACWPTSVTPLTLSKSQSFP